MGINLVVVCHEHKLYGYSMRGEEPADLQWWFREHRECFKARKVTIHRDCDPFPGDDDRDPKGYKPAWEYEDRPATRVFPGVRVI